MGVVKIWERFLDSLDTPGGHICMLFALLLFGAAGARMGVPKGEDIVLGSFGALLAGLRPAQSSHVRYTNDKQAEQRKETL